MSAAPELPGQEPDERLVTVAGHAMDAVRVRLMMAFRFLDRALWKMPHVAAQEPWMIASDGRALRFGPAAVVSAYRADPALVARTYLHTLLHCIFRHPAHTVRSDLLAWQLACDICVEAICAELAGERFALACDDEVEQAAAAFAAQGVPLTPAGVYRALLLWRKQPPEDAMLRAIAADLEGAAQLFGRDSHVLWDLSQPPRQDEGGQQPAQQGGEGDDASGSGQGDADGSGGRGRPGAQDDAADGADGQGSPDDFPDVRPDAPGEPVASSGTGGASAEDGAPHAAAPAVAGDAGEAAPSSPAAYEVGPVARTASTVDRNAESEWADIAQQVEAELRTMDQQRGEGAGRLMGNLSLANRSRIDYADFLRRFATRAEETRLNDEEFDYLFYTYGLARYGNMPLIEPLEYKEDLRAREFVIAIDTSGSCSRGLTRLFVTRTYEILSSVGGAGARVNIRIIQCDAEVQQDTLITCMEDLREYERGFEVRGWGGTDFRPVFAYVDELVERRAFEDLRGVVYFTDGFGKFPDRAPDYDVAFVFVEREGKERRVPPWAMKVVMDEDDLELLEESGQAW